VLRTISGDARRGERDREGVVAVEGVEQDHHGNDRRLEAVSGRSAIESLATTTSQSKVGLRTQTFSQCYLNVMFAPTPLAAAGRHALGSAVGSMTSVLALCPNCCCCPLVNSAGEPLLETPRARTEQAHRTAIERLMEKPSVSDARAGPAAHQIEPIHRAES